MWVKGMCSIPCECVCFSVFICLCVWDIVFRARLFVWFMQTIQTRQWTWNYQTQQLAPFASPGSLEMITGAKSQVSMHTKRIIWHDTTWSRWFSMGARPEEPRQPSESIQKHLIHRVLTLPSHSGCSFFSLQNSWSSLRRTTGSQASGRICLLTPETLTLWSCSSPPLSTTSSGSLPSTQLVTVTQAARHYVTRQVVLVRNTLETGNTLYDIVFHADTTSSSGGSSYIIVVVNLPSNLKSGFFMYSWESLYSFALKKATSHILKSCWANLVSSKCIFFYVKTSPRYISQRSTRMGHQKRQYGDRLGGETNSMTIAQITQKTTETDSWNVRWT